MFSHKLDKSNTNVNRYVSLMQFYAMCVRMCVYSADVESFLCLLTCEDNEFEAHGLKEKISVLIPTTWRTLQEKDNSHINKTTTGYKTRYHKSQSLRVLFQLILASSHICIPLQSNWIYSIASRHTRTCYGLKNERLGCLCCNHGNISIVHAVNV